MSKSNLPPRPPTSASTLCTISAQSGRRSQVNVKSLTRTPSPSPHSVACKSLF